MPRALPEAFHCFYQAGTFIVCFERNFFNTPISLTVKAQVKFCTKFNGHFGFPPDDRTKPGLRNTYNAVFHGVYFVIIHILLLFIQRDDGQILGDLLLVFHGISVTHELFQMPDVPYHITKLSAEYLSDFLFTMFSAFGKCMVIFSGASPVTSWQWQTIRLAKTVNDRPVFLLLHIRSEKSCG